MTNKPVTPALPDVVTTRLMIADAESVIGIERTMWELIRPKMVQAGLPARSGSVPRSSYREEQGR
jgi:hypothetical protein